jgi:alkaline phosphatase
MDVTKTKKFKTVAEYAKERGKKVGIITSVSLDHATPACFYAKVPSRKDMYDIALQIALSNFDFFGGGGFE